MSPEERLRLVAAAGFRLVGPPEDLSVSEWAGRYRMLSSEASYAPGRWRNEKTPYLVEVMDAISDPTVSHVALVSPSQVGKTEVLLNTVGWAITTSPGSMLFVQPTLEMAGLFSEQRIGPMLRDTPALAASAPSSKSRDAASKKLLKLFPGSMLRIAGANSAPGLCQQPARFVFGDEIDRWPSSIPGEGEPWGLAVARTISYPNRKLIRVSTPTIEGESPIIKAFEQGTKERWHVECQGCGKWSVVALDAITFEKDGEAGKPPKKVWDVGWACPGCGVVFAEEQVREFRAKWIAENPDAFERGYRSFWLTGWVNPWCTWDELILEWLTVRRDPEKLQVFWNTKLGLPWTPMDTVTDEQELLDRCEEFPCEVPDGVKVLTAGVDVQDNRLEYVILGHGVDGEVWGIEYGQLMGEPDEPAVWAQLDGVLDKARGREDGEELVVAATFVDSGGHYTHEVYAECAVRTHRHVYPIKGVSRQGWPFVPRSKTADFRTRDGRTGGVARFDLNVDDGKGRLARSLKRSEPGPRYWHFPLDPEAGFDRDFFKGLLSERLVWQASGRRRVWVKVSPSARNEPLDCCVYALACQVGMAPEVEKAEAFGLKDTALAPVIVRKRTRRVKVSGGV